MKLSLTTRGFTLIELMFTTVLIGVLGLIIYSLLNTGMVLGAKNTAVNTAHQQARVAMLEMLQNLHSSVSVPALAQDLGAAVAVVRAQFDAEQFAHLAIEVGDVGPSVMCVQKVPLRKALEINALRHAHRDRPEI